MEIRESAIIQVSDPDVGQTIIDEVFSPEQSLRFKKNHPLGSSVDEFVARDPGDSLIILQGGLYKFWDSASGKVSILGKNPSEFVIGYDE